MKKYLSYILILCLFLFGFTTYIDLAANYHWTGIHIFDSLTIGPTDEDACIGLPRANQTGEEAGDCRITFEGDNVVVQAMVNSLWTTLAYDATTKSFKIPQVYTVSGSDSFGINDAGISTVINEYTVAAADSWALSDVGTNTLDTGECSTFSTDKCTGGTAFESGHESSYVAANAFANDASSTWWQQPTTPEYIGYDFGSGVTHVIRQVRVYTGNSFGAFSKDYTISGSNTSTTEGFTTLATGTFADSVGWKEVPFANTTGYRFIKISIDTYWGSNYAVISEVEMQTCAD